MRTIARFAVLLSLCFTVACGDDGTPTDTGPADTGTPDANGDADAGPTEDPEVVIDTGGLRGIREDGVRKFLGIPYADFPMRYTASGPVEPWDEVRDAQELGAICPQLDLITMNFGGEEDCLHLNVWAPEDAENAPVMLYVHGGAFKTGDGSYQAYDGSVLAREHGVVVVTINYRLGFLGFLAHPALTAENAEYPSSGNYGMGDILQSMQWVQRNIAAFGGDPESVMLFGLSSGSDGVATVALSPMAEGLYSRLGLLSGALTILPAFPTLAEAEVKGTQIATALGCESATDPADTIACLRALPAQDAVGAAIRELTGYEALPGGIFYQGNPSLDPDFYQFNVDGFIITRTFNEAAAAGELPDVPIMLGHVTDEGTVFQSPILEGTITTVEEYESAINTAFGPSAATVMAAYPVADYASPNAALTAVTTDGVFVCPGRIAATAAADNGTPVYKYLLQVASDSPTLASFGIFHGADTPFIFGSIDPFWGRVPPDIEPVAVELRDYIVRFAATGDPNGGSSIEWPLYTADTDTHLTIQDPIATEANYKQDLCDMWASVTIE